MKINCNTATLQRTQVILFTFLKAKIMLFWRTDETLILDYGKCDF